MLRIVAVSQEIDSEASAQVIDLEYILASVTLDVSHGQSCRLVRVLDAKTREYDQGLG